MTRYIGNNSTGSYIGRNSSKLESNDIFRSNAQTLNNDVTIQSDENASCAGPLTIADGATLAVNGNLTVV